LKSWCCSSSKSLPSASSRIEGAREEEKRCRACNLALVTIMLGPLTQYCSRTPPRCVLQEEQHHAPRKNFRPPAILAWARKRRQSRRRRRQTTPPLRFQNGRGRRPSRTQEGSSARANRRNSPASFSPARLRKDAHRRHRANSGNQPAHFLPLLPQ